jgi:hypothetical protein
MEKTNIIQLPSATLHRTDEKKVNSNPKKTTAKHSTMMMRICHIRSITRVNKTVVVIITPISAIPESGKRKRLNMNSLIIHNKLIT